MFSSSMKSSSGRNRFLFSPWGQKLEEEIGLPLLFKLRGPRKPPDETVVVSLDQEPATRLPVTLCLEY